MLSALSTSCQHLMTQQTLCLYAFLLPPNRAFALLPPISLALVGFLFSSENTTSIGFDERHLPTVHPDGCTQKLFHLFITCELLIFAYVIDKIYKNQAMTMLENGSHLVYAVKYTYLYIYCHKEFPFHSAPSKPFVMIECNDLVIGAQICKFAKTMKNENRNISKS